MSNAGNQVENSQEDNSVSSTFDSRLSGERIFIVGANGQLGTALRNKYPKAQYADVNELDITDKTSVEQFDWSNIDILINAAAYTDVDGAETPEGLVKAWSVNADAVANLVAVTARFGMTLVHISTDYVFDGTMDNHKEDEPFSPLSVYGASKAAGDIIVSLAPKFYILRTSWVIGEGNNFVRTMVELAKKGISPTVVHDQIGRLTFTSELVRAIDHLIKYQITGSREQKNNGLQSEKVTKHGKWKMENVHPYGTYNVTNSGPSISWADITRKIFKILKKDDLSVTNTTTAEYFAGKTNIAPRPLQSTLNLDKIHSTGFKSTNWQDELLQYIQKEITGNK